MSLHTWVTLSVYSGTWRSMLFPFGRFSPASTLICLQSWRHAFLRQPLDFWGTRWVPLLCFLSAKFCCIPTSLRCTWVLQCCCAALMAGHGGHQEALHRVTQSYRWPMVPADVPSYVQACYVCTRAKKQMQRLQGLSQPLPMPEQLWPVISMDFIYVSDPDTYQ